MAIIKII